MTGNVDVSTVPFARLPGQRRGTIETAGIVYDEDGAVAATVETERTAMDVADADFGPLASSGIPYQRAVALSPGRYQVRWDGRSECGELVATGVYFYRMTAGNFVEARKMVLLK